MNRFLFGSRGARLSPQDSLAGFCRAYYQEPGSTALEPEDDLDTLSETERNIIENRNYIIAELTSARLDRREAPRACDLSCGTLLRHHHRARG